MITAIQSALSGMNTATTRLNEAAANIARASAAATEAASQTLSDAPSGPPPVGTAFTGPRPVFGDDTSLVGELVALKEAEILYKASAKVLGVVGDLEQQLLDITG